MTAIADMCVCLHSLQLFFGHSATPLPAKNVTHVSICSVYLHCTLCPPNSRESVNIDWSRSRLTDYIWLAGMQPLHEVTSRLFSENPWLLVVLLSVPI